MTRAIIENKKIIGFETIKEKVVIDREEIERRQKGVAKKYIEKKMQEVNNYEQ